MIVHFILMRAFFLIVLTRKCEGSLCSFKGGAQITVPFILFSRE